MNRDLGKEREVELVWREAGPSRVLTCQTLTGTNLKAVNTFEQPKRVAPGDLDPPRPGPRMLIKLPARSYTLVQMKLG